MGKSLKQINKENARDEKVQEAAFLLFADQTIEGVSMGDIAKAAEIGRTKRTISGISERGCSGDCKIKFRVRVLYRYVSKAQNITSI